MKTIIAGSRDITDYALVERAIKESGIQITEVVSGTARGVDKLGECWALNNLIPVKRFPADWNKFGKAAGYLRNEQMAQYAEAFICIRKDFSAGTTHMINIGKRLGLRGYVLDV